MTAWYLHPIFLSSLKLTATGLVLKYIVKGWKDIVKTVKEDEEHCDEYKEIMTYLKDAETARLSRDKDEVIALIDKHQFAWEHLSTEFLKSVEVSEMRKTVKQFCSHCPLVNALCRL